MRVLKDASGQNTERQAELGTGAPDQGFQARPEYLGSSEAKNPMRRWQ
jgi:hypothetical protein